MLRYHKCSSQHVRSGGKYTVAGIIKDSATGICYRTNDIHALFQQSAN